MIDFLVSVPAILCRADVRHLNTYAHIRQSYANRHDYSAQGIYADALITTINQFNAAKEVVLSEQATPQKTTAI